MKKILHRPWLHFLLIGTGLFLLQGWLYPEPLPSVGPLAESQIDNLRRQWFSTTGRMPDEQQVTRMVAAELDREILFREGLALEIHRIDPIVRQRLIRNMQFLGLGEDRSHEELYQDALRMELHLGDEVVKRRLIQVMEQLLLSRHPPPLPTDAQVTAAFEGRRDELQLPPRFTLEQVFLSRERAGEAAAVLERIRQEQLTPAQALELSSPFLPGYRFVGQSPTQLARHFGSAFVLNLEQQKPVAGRWSGPVQSTYGSHLVWVESIEPGREPSLEEVKERLVRDLSLEIRRQTLADAVAELRGDYEVIL